MIVTLTPNPSLDVTYDVERLDRGDVVRARDRRVEPGGKGINVARALHAHGHAVRAVLPCGGAEGDQLLGLLLAAGLEVDTVPIAGRVRTNVTVAETDGTTTKINEPGPPLREQDVQALLEAAAAAARGSGWVVGSGSLPPGADDGAYADLIRRVRTAGGRVAVDTSGRALALAVAAAPDLCKPNLDELAELAGCPLPTVGDVLDAAASVRSLGVTTVLVSLGADGVVLLDDGGALHGERPVSAPRSTVGAGDAALAGYLAALPDGREAALRSAVAFGAAAVALPGTQMPGPSDVHPDLVVVTDDPARGRRLGVRPTPPPVVSGHR